MANPLFGWDLIFRSIENEIEKKEDVLVAFTHWYFIKLGFTCVGNGTGRTLVGDEVKTEALPARWNKLSDFNLRYVHRDAVYLFRGIVSDDDIIFNFLRGEDLAISSCMFGISETVEQMTGHLTTMIPSYKSVMAVLEKELVSPIFMKPTCVVATQTPDRNAPIPDDPYSVDPMRPPRRRPPNVPEMDPFWDPLRDPRAIGRNDVDPFGHGVGGGMIFDPFRPRRDPRGAGPSFPDGLPRGAVPPGARFDPFGPPGTGRGGRPDPDPDHLPPPGYDDIFM